MKKLTEFQLKIDKRLKQMDDSISQIEKSLKDLSSEYKSFKKEVRGFVQLCTDCFADHEKRITKIEEKVNKKHP